MLYKDVAGGLFCGFYLVVFCCFMLARLQFFSLSGALLKRVEFACLYSIQFRPLDADAAAMAAEAQKEIIEGLKVYKSGEAPLAPGAEGSTKIGNFAPTGRSLSSLTQSRGVSSCRSIHETREPTYEEGKELANNTYQPHFAVVMHTAGLHGASAAA